jgi:hypothetical protein
MLDGPPERIMPSGAQDPNLFSSDGRWFYLAVYAAFAHPAGDQLIELGSEVDDDNHGYSPS